MRKDKIGFLFYSGGFVLFRHLFWNAWGGVKRDGRMEWS